MLYRTTQVIVLAFIAAVALAGCGADLHRQVPAEFETYVSAFEAAWGQKVTGISFGHDDLPDGVVAQCEIGGGRRIVVSNAYWPNQSEDGRTETIFHELGHCALNRAHTYGYVGTRPSSIMDPYVLGDYLFDTYRTDYVSELFSGNGPFLGPNAGIIQGTSGKIVIQ